MLKILKNRLLFMIPLTILCNASLAQQEYHLDELCNLATSGQVHTIRKVFEFDDSLRAYRFQDFDVDRILKQEGYVRAVNDREPVGKIIYFYENGNKEEEGVYDKGKKGIWRGYYENGQLKEVLDYDVGGDQNLKSPRFKMISFYDTLGNPTVENGTGLYTSYGKDGKIMEKGVYRAYFKEGQWEGFFGRGTLYYKESYKSGVLIKGTSYDSLGTEFTYTIVEDPPLPKGGYETFYRFISKTMTYPKSARKNRIEGKVYVRFFVDENGFVVDPKIIKGADPALDIEALRVIRMSPLWKPGLSRGQPVKVKMIIPLTFKLE